MDMFDVSHHHSLPVRSVSNIEPPFPEIPVLHNEPSNNASPWDALHRAALSNHFDDAGAECSHSLIGNLSLWRPVI